MASSLRTEDGHPSTASPLPTQSPEIIGRQKEIAEIVQLLVNPACRLLTLVGLGGIGKTTLALQLANQSADTQMMEQFHHGVYLIPLQAVHGSELLLSSLAEELGIALSGTDEPLLQICRYLQDKSLLLIFDNFEHLLAGADMLATLLHAAPTVKMLVTSREALNLREEWLYPVQGLGYPRNNSIHNSRDDIESYGAVHLFSERAHRMRPDFSLADEQESVVRICRLVEGTPLALELAATWTKTLRCAEIAAEIEKSLDFLTSRLRNVPDRHRSMLAVFEHSWQLLSNQEQDVFMRLCAFRGGFERRAAAAVMGASLPILSSVVDKSLLRMEVDGRYQMHELLRQFAQEKLEAEPEAALQVYNAHCTYFTDFLHVRSEDMWGKRQQEAMQEIDAEIDNVRAALKWATAQERVEEVIKATDIFGLFNQFRSRYQESATTFEQIIHMLENGNVTHDKQIGLTIVGTALGWVYIRLGQLDNAQRVLQQSQRLYAQLGIPPLAGNGTDPDAPLGLVCLIKGDYAGAIPLAEASLHRNRQAGNQPNIQYAHYILAGAALGQGNYETAHHHAQQAHATAQNIGDRWFMAYCLTQLGRTEQALGNLATAFRHYQTSYSLRQEFHDPEGMAVALTHLGQIALLQANYADAQRLYAESRAIYLEINDRGGLATALDGLGTAATALGAYTSACRYFHAALQLAIDIQFVPLIFSLFLHIGELFLKTEKEARGLALFAMTHAHPAVAQDTKEQAARLLEQYDKAYENQVPSDLQPTASRRDPADTIGADTVGADSIGANTTEPDTIKSMAASLLLQLSTADDTIAPLPPASPQFSSHHSSSASQTALVEPLTDRELEVLGLLVHGLTNQQIADKLVVALGTVKSHNHSIYAKLGVSNRTSAVARAQELHLL